MAHPARRLLLSCLALGLSGSACAEDDDLEALLRREVQGPSRYAQSLLDAPANVAVLTQREAAALGHWTVAEMLARLPGVHLSSSRQYSEVGLRGLNRPGDYNARLLVTIDGLRVNDPIYDQALPEFEFPLVAEWVKRAELVYGPGSSVYGANALLGVVNLVTLDGADAPGLRGKLSLGSFGTQRLVLGYGQADAAGGDLYVGLHAVHSRGESLDLPELGLGGPVRGLDGLRQTAFLLKYRHGAWRFGANAMQRDKNLATAPYGSLPGVPGSRVRDGYAHLELGYEEDWSDALRRSLRVGLVRTAYDGAYRYEADQINVDEARSLALSLDTRLQWRGWLNDELLLGMDARWSPQGDQRNEDLQPPALRLDSRVRTHRAGLFVQDQWRLSGAWQLTTGLRLDHIRDYGAQWSPRVALVWRPQAQESLKLLLGQAFRTPNLVERFYADGYTQRPNPDLRPERLRSVEVGWERALDARSVLSLSLYSARLHRVIELHAGTSDELAQYLNLAPTRSHGLDLGLAQDLGSGWQWRADLSLMHARREGQRLSNSPAWLLKGHGLAPLAPHWSVGLEGQGQGRRTGRADVPAQFVANALLRFEDGAHTLGLRVLNLADRRLLDPAGPDNDALLRVPQARRAVRLDWQWRL